jgi:hypothetical protein
MRATKLNAQVQLTNLRVRAMYERGTATSVQRRQLDLEYQDWARLQGRGLGPHTAGGHGRNRHVGCWPVALRSSRRRPGPGTARTSEELELDACPPGT